METAHNTPDPEGLPPSLRAPNLDRLDETPEIDTDSPFDVFQGPRWQEGLKADPPKEESPVENSKAPNHRGYARHFESRPEYLYGRHVRVVNAAPGVRERAIDDLLVVQIKNIFAGPNETFMGFGKPNTFIVSPGDKDQYKKFSGKSLRRGPADIVDTKGWVQTGAFVRFKELSEEASEALNKSTQALQGRKFWTCVNACGTALENAGFTSGEKPLSTHYFPIKLLQSFHDNGLYYKGTQVPIDIIRTIPITFEGYSVRVFLAELSAMYRHALRAAKPVLEKSSIGKKIYRGLASPLRFENKDKVQAPGLPAGNEYLNDLQLRASHPIKIGMLFRLFCGPHTLFEVRQNRVNVDEHLPNVLKAFPNPKPSIGTILKQKFLFSKPVVAVIRNAFFARYEGLGTQGEEDIYDMLRTHTDEQNNRYNIVIAQDRLLVARTHIKTPLVDWIMSKHVLMSGYNPNIRFAGEIWKDEEGTIWIGPNSGTYCPSDEQLDGAVEFLRSVFPHLNIQKAPYDKNR